MSIYEFSCSACRQKASLLVRSALSPITPRCPACGNTELLRAVSSFAVHRSISSIHESGDKPVMFQSPNYYKDPRNIGRWAEKKFQDMGIEMPSPLQDKIKAAREGELPDSLKELKSATPDASYH